MENFDQPLDAGMNTGDSGRGLKVTPALLEYWSSMASWALFFSILMFIVLALLALGLVFGIAMAREGGVAIAIFMLLYGALLFFPAWYLYKFSSTIKQALSNDSTDSLMMGFEFLKRYYRFMGILVIGIVGLYILMFVVGISLLPFMNYN